MKRPPLWVLTITLVTGVLRLSTAAPVPLSEKLLFMGENTEVVTIVSGKPELPRKAPAVVSVVESRDLEDSGYRTLSEILNTIPGLFVYPTAYGEDLYMRGVRSGLLMLYDGVPLTTDALKSVYPLSEELDVDYVKRIEVVKGPASTLWGPDAFSGVLNIVPKRGRDINGMRVKAYGSSPDAGRKLSVLWGHDNGAFDVMGFAGYTAKKGYLGRKKQEFWEALFKVNYKDSVDLTLRLSGKREPYKKYKYNWVERKDVPFGLLKLEYKRKFSKTMIKVKGSFIRWSMSFKIGTYSWEYKDDVYGVQGIVSRELFDKKGMLSFGLEFRRNLVSRAVVDIKGYIPDYLSSKSPMEPIFDKRSFDTCMKSVFVQYIHRLEKATLWAGFRLDDHTDYKSAISYTSGVGVYPSDNLSLKLSAGTAYRTPYASQFLKDQVSPERIGSLNLNISYNPVKRIGLEATLFLNSVKRHIGEDPYAGLSRPVSYRVRGIELGGYWKAERYKLWISATFLGVSDSYERYRVLDYILLTPTGESEYVYKDIVRKIPSGPPNTYSMGLVVHPTDGVTASLVYYRWSSFGDYNHKDIVNGYIKIKTSKKASFFIKAENMFNDRSSDLEGTRIFAGVEVSF